MLRTKENNEFSKWWHDWVSSREQNQMEMQHSASNGPRPGSFAECAADEEDRKLAHDADVAQESHVL